MQPDPEYLRRHYALLSDEALLEMDRADLVEVAQQLYDHEIARRGLLAAGDERLTESVPDSHDDLAYEPTPDADRPVWLDDATVAISYNVYPGASGPPPAADACDALRGAGIPCFLDLVDAPSESVSVEPTGQWLVMVPDKFSFQASGVLDKEIFNAELEESWKAHLERLSDEDLTGMSPRQAFCGLFDRIERVTKIYNEELARRRGTAG